MPIHLTERDPRVPADRLVAELVPPPRFADVSFDSYRPDPAQPSQQQAVDVLREFAGNAGGAAPEAALSGKARAHQGPGGVYLDGGYGVGKTHLLASLWHTAPGPKLFATFVELTHLVGALGFHDAVDRPVVLHAGLRRRVRARRPGRHGAGLHAADPAARGRRPAGRHSNTLPGKLGEGRFATDDFLREIQGLSAHFESVRIDGEDYRHRGLPEAPAAPDLDAVQPGRRARRARASTTSSTCPGTSRRCTPRKYGALLDGVRVVCLEDVRTVDDQAVALRLVVLADRMYDRDLPVVASGVTFDALFAPQLLEGGYRKKYFRAISRLVALAREGDHARAESGTSA